MHSHKYKRAKEVNVDECYQCGGFFLDSGELTEIRDHHMSDAEVTAYTQQLAASVPEYGKELKDIDAERTVCKRFTDLRGSSRQTIGTGRFCKEPDQRPPPAPIRDASSVADQDRLFLIGRCCLWARICRNDGDKR